MYLLSLRYRTPLVLRLLLDCTYDTDKMAQLNILVWYSNQPGTLSQEHRLANVLGTLSECLYAGIRDTLKEILLAISILFILAMKRSLPEALSV